MAISLLQLKDRFRHELPRLNQAVLYGGAPPTAVADGVAALALPSPTPTSSREGQRLVNEPAPPCRGEG